MEALLRGLRIGLGRNHVARHIALLRAGLGALTRSSPGPSLRDEYSPDEPMASWWERASRFVSCCRPCGVACTLPPPAQQRFHPPHPRYRGL